MRPRSDFKNNRTLECRSCGASFHLDEARLHFEGCNRVGKGVTGTNIKVRNDARAILSGTSDEINGTFDDTAEATVELPYGMASRVEYAAAWGVRPELTDDELYELLIDDPYTFTKEEALRALWVRGCTEHLRRASESDIGVLAERAREGADNPCGGPIIPHFFNEKLNPPVD